MIKEAKRDDLKVIVKCHRKAFPNALSSMLGQEVSYRILEWYIGSSARFLLWVEEGDQCIGYAGGMILNGSEAHGSASSMIQYSFKKIFFALLTRPWLWLHPNILSRYPLIIKNLYFKIRRYNNPSNRHRRNIPVIPHVGLVVIGVSPNKQGRGYGSLLLKAFEEKVKSLGYFRMSLTVLASNKVAIKSYLTNGWKIMRENSKSVNMYKNLAESE